MGVVLDKVYEYEVKELIKAFGITDFNNLNFEIKEQGEQLIFNLLFEDKSFKYSCSLKGLPSVKLGYKQGTYRVFSEALGIELPWGILTGIRPIKLVQKHREEDIETFLKAQYFISDIKIKSILEISKVQDDLIKKIDLEHSIGIYIGIPFCPSRCSYCSFFSSDINKSAPMVKPYIESLLKEIDMVLPYIKDRKISSLYFGGGTPSALDSKDITYLLEEVNKRFDFSRIYEVCFEAGRPDTLDKKKLIAIKEGLIDRISINPQTMNDETLKLIGRNHSSQDIVRAFKTARSIGFDNINMDIILGLENEGVNEVEYTMKALADLCPDSITVHTLARKRASKLFQQENKIEPGDVEAQMNVARDHCQNMGLIPYYLYRQKNIKGNLENLGLSKADKISAYNIGIMEEIQSIIAFGAGGVSKFCYPEENRLERVENVKNLEEYLNRYEEMAARKINQLML